MYSRVYVEITNICNMHCSFCHGHSRPMRRMEEKEFLHVLEELKNQTKYIYYHLMGEPLTHPDLPRFLRMASDRGFLSVITTNGTLLPKCGKELIEAGVYKVSISLHSFEEGDAQEYARYLNGVCDFAEAASAAGVIVVLRLWNRGYDGGKNDDILAFLRSRFSGEWAENTRGIRIRHRLHLEWGDRFVWPDKDAAVVNEQVYCYGLGDHFGILCDGTVVPCCMDSDGVIALGNVLEEPLEKILNSGRALAMIEGFACHTPSEELCRRCAYAMRFL